MEEIVIDYLNKNFKIGKDLRIYAILESHGIIKYRFDFINEITTIFSIEEDDVKKLVEKWNHLYYNNIDLTDYWKYGAGIAYIPYIINTNIEIDFQPTESISSRYSRNQINPNYYGSLE